MHDFVLQDFTTIRGAYNVSVTQSESSWLDLEEYEDLIVWLDIREITLPTGTSASVTLNLQTAPIKDEYLFVNMVTGYTNTTGAPPTSAQIFKVILAQNPTVPLGRFVRWQIVPTVNGGSAVWDMTFRILCCANQVGPGRRVRPSHSGGR